MNCKRAAARRPLARALGRLAVFGLAAACAGSTFAATARPTSLDAAVAALLAVSGPDEVPTLAGTARVAGEMRAIVRRLGAGLPDRHRARRLHRLLHRRYLRRYDPDADNLTAIVAHGRYNCLSSTLFYGLVARELGYPTEAVSLPGHLLLRLTIDGRRVYVETTKAGGFDIDEHALGRAVPAGGAQPASRPYVVGLDQALGFAWLNRAWRELESGTPLRAAESVAHAARYLPDLAGRAEGARQLLAKAGRQARAAGRRDAAERIAQVGARLFPHDATPGARQSTGGQVATRLTEEGAVPPSSASGGPDEAR